MAFNTPDQTTATAANIGAAKGKMAVGPMLVGGFLAGAYIAFGGLLAIVVSSGLDPAQWGGITALITGAVFPVGLMLVVIAGAELLTGNMALVPLAAMRKKITWAQVSANMFWVLIGNLAGSLFLAYFIAYKTGVIGAFTSDPASQSATYIRTAGIVTGKALKETDTQIFLRAIGCNWLVCLAVWLAISAKDVVGKIFGIWFPILAFVALGFDHVVANMFFLPLGVFIGVPGVGWGDVVNNWVFAFLGNFVGAGVFVAAIYYYLHLHGKEESEILPAGPAPDRPGIAVGAAGSE